MSETDDPIFGAMARIATQERDRPFSPETQAEWDRILLKYTDTHAQSAEDNRKARKKFAWAVFWLVVLWLVAVLVLLILNGAGALRLSDNVLIAILSGSVVQVIGLFAAVAKYLFR